jgi:hypothetical protein
MMITQKFERRPFYVDAVQVTADNIEDAARWCGGDVRNSARDRDNQTEQYVKVRVYRPLNPRQTQAFLTDWILFAGTGYKVYTDKAFKNSFILAEEEHMEDVSSEPEQLELLEAEEGDFQIPPAKPYHDSEVGAPELFRDAGTGLFVTEKYAVENPETTVKEVNVRDNADRVVPGRKAEG